MPTKKLKGWKCFNADMTCRDFQFKVGKTFKHEGKVELCGAGFHFHENQEDLFSFYPFNEESTCVCEVEATGEIISGDNKSVCSKIKVLRKLTWEEVRKLVNSGKENTGLRNSGHRNSGYYNSGDYNSGYYNSGDYNSGNRNIGNRNSGAYNSGYYNSGHRNSGHRNSGHDNSGDYNSGNYNSGNYNSGYFNTDEPTVRMFNKDTGKKRDEITIPYIELKLTEWIPASRMTDEQKRADKNFHIKQGTLIQRTYKKAWAEAWSKLANEKQQEFLTLPNFDADIFEEVTGIKVDQGEKTLEDCNGKIVEIDGVEYELRRKE